MKESDSASLDQAETLDRPYEAGPAGAVCLPEGVGSVGHSASGAKLDAFCPVYASLMDLLSRKWMGLILRVLMSQGRPVQQIHAAITGLSDPLLAQRLRELEAKGLVKRSVLSTSPVHVEYELKKAGQDLERAVRALSDWASKWWGDAVLQQQGREG